METSLISLVSVPARRALRFQFACSILANSRKTLHRVKSLSSMHCVLVGNSSEPKHRAQRSYFFIAIETKVLLPNARVACVYCRICMNLVKHYPLLRKTAESNDCERITVTNIEIFASFANNSSACCASCLTAVRLIQRPRL